MTEVAIMSNIIKFPRIKLNNASINERKLELLAAHADNEISDKCFKEGIRRLGLGYNGTLAPVVNFPKQPWSSI